MRTKLRLFKYGRAVVSRFAPWLSAAHSALWMRLLNEHDLDEITIHSYAGKFGSGFESAAHNQNGLLPWEESAFREYLVAGSRVLVAGAGGGREMIELARQGFEVVGFDATQDLVEACRQHIRATGVSGEILHAPAGKVPSGIGLHDALIIGRGVYHHIPRRARRIEFLSACRAHLKPGSPFILGDVLTRDDQRPTKRGATIERGDHIGSAFFHYFTHGELEAEFDEAGFAMVEVRITPTEAPRELVHAIARQTIARRNQSARGE